MTINSQEDFAKWLRKTVKAKKERLYKICMRTGLSSTTMTDCLHGHRNTSLNTILLLLNDLGAHLEIVNEKGENE